MPVTISRPRAPAIISTAAMKARPSPSWMAVASVVMPPASASSVRTAEAISARARSLVGLSVLSGFDISDLSLGKPWGPKALGPGSLGAGERWGREDRIARKGAGDDLWGPRSTGH